MSQEEQQLVLKRLLAAHEAWFNVSEGYTFAGRDFEGYAEFHSVGEKYILTKRAKLWEVNAFEYLFFKLADNLTAADIEGYISFMTGEAIKKVKPEKDHMSSFISLVLIANSCDEGVAAAVRKAKFRKNFALGLRGWADLRLGLVDLGTRTVTTNAAGKKLRPTLERNAGFDSSPKRTRRK